MFTNKHVVIALVVAPILSVLSWYAVGSLTGEQAAPAQTGRDYPLVAKSSCRWASGQCELENADFELTLRYSGTGHLLVHSVLPLDGVMVSVYDPTVETDLPPVALLPADGSGRDWRHPASAVPAAGERIRLVASTHGSRYYGEMSSQFVQSEDGKMPHPGK